MSTTTIPRHEAPWFRRLYLPAYRVTDVARYVDVHPNTVAAWHYRAKPTPVLPGKEHKRPLSYFQLVEVAFVAFFRKMGVSMPRIRAARDYVAQNFNVEFPFAEYKFKTEGYRVLMDQIEVIPTREFDQVIVADAGGQMAWSKLLGDKFAEFDYEYELALRWHPAGRQSRVVIDPRVSFGAPVVSGLPTWVIKGRYIAGETIPEIEQEFVLPREAIQDALVFEGLQRAA